MTQLDNSLKTLQREVAGPTLSRRLEQRLELLPLPVHAIDARLHRRLLCAQLDGSRGVAARRKHLLAERLELRLRRRDVDLQLRELLGRGGAPLLLPALLVRVIRRCRVLGLELGS